MAACKSATPPAKENLPTAEMTAAVWARVHGVWWLVHQANDDLRFGREAALCMESGGIDQPRDTARAMSEENVEQARKAIDALNRGDLDAWLAFLSPDVVWEALPGVPGLGELYRGRAEVREWIEQLFELAEGGIHTEIEQLTDLGDDRVFLAIVLTARGRGSGVPFEMPNWEVIWFSEGLVTRRQIFWTRDEALEAAGLSE
jgi:ketosteroid isomerase-like protein